MRVADSSGRAAGNKVIQAEGTYIRGDSTAK